MASSMNNPTLSPLVVTPVMRFEQADKLAMEARRMFDKSDRLVQKAELIRAEGDRILLASDDIRAMGERERNDIAEELEEVLKEYEAIYVEYKKDPSQLPYLRNLCDAIGDGTASLKDVAIFEQVLKKVAAEMSSDMSLIPEHPSDSNNGQDTFESKSATEGKADESPSKKSIQNKGWLDFLFYLNPRKSATADETTEEKDKIFDKISKRADSRAAGNKSATDYSDMDKYDEDAKHGVKLDQDQEKVVEKDSQDTDTTTDTELHHESAVADMLMESTELKGAFNKVSEASNLSDDNDKFVDSLMFTDPDEEAELAGDDHETGEIEQSLQSIEPTDSAEKKSCKSSKRSKKNKKVKALMTITSTSTTTATAREQSFEDFDSIPTNITSTLNNLNQDDDTAMDNADAEVKFAPAPASASATPEPMCKKSKKAKKVKDTAGAPYSVSRAAKTSKKGKKQARK